MTTHDDLCESVEVDIGVGDMHSPCSCRERALLKEIEDLKHDLERAMANHNADLTITRPEAASAWRKCADGEGAECKGVHFLRAEAAAGGNICVTALLQGEFYEYLVKVPPLTVSPHMRTEKTDG